MQSMSGAENSVRSVGEKKNFVGSKISHANRDSIVFGLFTCKFPGDSLYRRIITVTTKGIMTMMTMMIVREHHKTRLEWLISGLLKLCDLCILRPLLTISSSV